MDLPTVLRLLKQLRSARLNGCMMIFKVFFLTPTFFQRRFLMWIQTIKLPEFWFDFLDDEFWFWFVLFLVRFFVFFPPLTIVISIFFIRYITLLIFPWTFWINKLKGVVLEKLGHIRVVKVSKSQKHFFLETPLPKKRTRYLTKFCPIKLGNISFVFWAMEFQEKMLLRFTDL